jgi:hypothetical protein
VLPPTPRYSVPLDERRRLGCSRRERMRLLVPAWIWNLAVSFGCCTRTISTGPVSCIDKGCYARSLVLKEHRVSPSIHSVPSRRLSSWHQPAVAWPKSLVSTSTTEKKRQRTRAQHPSLRSKRVCNSLQNYHISADTYKTSSAIPPQRNTYRNSSLRTLLSSAMSAASSLSSTGSSTTI